MLRRRFRALPKPPPLGRRGALLAAPAFVLGAGVYMWLPEEPNPWMVATFVLAALAALGFLRQSERARWPAIWLLVAALGFGWAMARADWAAAPRLEREASGMLAGKVAFIETGPKRDRITLESAIFETRGRASSFKRTRFTVRDAGGLAIGDRIEVPAVLRPPGAPVAPGGYDFRRDAYFQGLGAVGFSIGKIEVQSTDRRGDWFARARVAFRAQAYAALPDRPDLAGVLAALTVGDRSGVVEADREALRASGLAHLLAISGLHLGMAATSVFLALRLLFALPHGFALRYPAHKVAAAFAILAAAAYLGVSGAAPPAERAFVTVLAAMIAVMTDRLRSGLWFIGWAAIVVAVVSPHVVAGPSFQLSFAAVIGIVAVYDAWLGRRHDRENRPLEGLGVMRPVVVYVGGILGASLIATLATAPLALAHFQQAPLYGVAANLAAMPAMAFIIMPAAIMAGLLAPFDLAGPPLVAMGFGVDLVLGVAHTVASWPGGVVRIPAAPAWTAGAFLLGLALMACLKGWPRLLGLLGPAAALVGMVAVAPADLLIDGRARLAAAHSDGVLYVSSLRRGAYERDNWRRLVGAAEARAMADSPDFQCDDRGCAFILKGATTAVSWAMEGYPADCRNAGIVLALYRAPRGRGLDCMPGLTRIDLSDVAAQGAHAIWIEEGRPPRIKTVAEISGSRPWFGQDQP